ncbi:hypothetical protein DIPPA_20947 [Diplonema papillatum]|nr:hypothetical protein DIPPA_20947 [Diplonema papillatum]
MGGGYSKEQGSHPKPADAWAGNGEAAGTGDDADLPADRGEKVAVLGLDGAGKSRLLDLLTGRDEFPVASKDAPYTRYTAPAGAAGKQLDFWVASGFSKHRVHWEVVAAGAPYMIFVLNACDCLRLPLAWVELVSRANQHSPRKLLVFVTRSAAPGSGPVATRDVLHACMAFAPLGNVPWASFDVNLSAPKEELLATVKAAVAWLTRSEPPQE